MKHLKVAGTSIGGSSYTQRLLDKILIAKPDELIAVRISYGVHRKKVHEKLKQAQADLESLASLNSTEPIKFNIRYIHE